MATVAKILEHAAERLGEAGVADPRREAASLVAMAIGRERSFLIAHPEYVLTAEEAERCGAAIGRRALREPLQYIRGSQEFFGLEFEVTSDVLIPRPETEAVVEAGLGFLVARPSPRILEIGVGSGCIIVSLLANCEDATGTGTDVSKVAIETARRNAERHGVDGRLELVEADVYSGLDAGRFDLIVSNPPYVPEKDMATLQEEVRRFEPRSALTDEGDGLTIIRRIVERAPDRLVPGGLLLMEIGFGQHRDVAGQFDEISWESVEFLPDLQGIPRVVSAARRGQ